MKRYFRVQTKEEAKIFSNDCIFVKITAKKQSKIYDLFNMKNEGFKITDYSNIINEHDNNENNINLCNSYQYKFNVLKLIENNFDFDNKVVYIIPVKHDSNKFSIGVTDSVFSIPSFCYYAASLPSYSIQYSIEQYKKLFNDNIYCILANSCIEFDCKVEFSNNNIFINSFIDIVKQQSNKYKDKGTALFDFRNYSLFPADLKFDAIVE